MRHDRARTDELLCEFPTVSCVGDSFADKPCRKSFILLCLDIWNYKPKEKEENYIQKKLFCVTNSCDVIMCYICVYLIVI